MSKLLNPQELKATIKSCFIANPKADKLLVTPDGQCFFETSKSAAEFHARRNQYKIDTVERKNYVDEKQEPSDADQGYGAKTVAELKQLLVDREITVDVKVSKTKADFVALLVADDEAKEAESKKAAAGAEGDKKE